MEMAAYFSPSMGLHAAINAGPKSAHFIEPTPRNLAVLPQWEDDNPFFYLRTMIWQFIH